MNKEIKRMNKLTRLSTLIGGGALGIAPAIQARTCSGNGDLLGGFGWSGSRAVPFVPATPVTAINGSTTQIGALTAGAANAAAFASFGREYPDDRGGLFSRPTPLTPPRQAAPCPGNSARPASPQPPDAFATPAGPGP